MCVCARGISLPNWKNPGVHEEIVKDRLYIYYKDLDVILVEKFLIEVKEVALSGFQQRGLAIITKRKKGLNKKSFPKVKKKIKQNIGVLRTLSLVRRITLESGTALLFVVSVAPCIGLGLSQACSMPNVGHGRDKRESKGRNLAEMAGRSQVEGM